MLFWFQSHIKNDELHEVKVITTSCNLSNLKKVINSVVTWFK